MRILVGIFLLFAFSQLYTLPVISQVMGGPPAGTLPPPCSFQPTAPACALGDEGSCWADINPPASALNPIFKVCNGATFVEVQKDINNIPATFNNLVKITTSGGVGAFINDSTTTLNGNATLAGPTTTISSATTNITGDATLSGSTATVGSMTTTTINGNATLAGPTTTISGAAVLSGPTIMISGAATHTGITNFNSTVNIGSSGALAVGANTNLDFGNNKLQNIDTPSVNSDAVRKDYVDTLAGGVVVNMTNPNSFDFGGKRLQNLADPDLGSPQDAATKNYVDTEIANISGGSGGVSKQYVSLATVTINGNTSTEISLVPTAVGDFDGSVTIPANTLIPGSVIRIKAQGHIMGNATSSAFMRFKLGSTTVNNSTIVPITGNLGGSADRLWEAEYIIICRTAGASGTVFGQGEFTYMLESDVRKQGTDFANTIPTTINTTIPQVIDLTWAWTTPFLFPPNTNTISSTNIIIEVLQ